MFLLSILAAASVVGEAGPAAIEVQVAKAPDGITLPLLVRSDVLFDKAGVVIRCTPRFKGPAEFGQIACKQMQSLPPVPVVTDENGRAQATVRSVTVAFVKAN